MQKKKHGVLAALTAGLILVGGVGGFARNQKAETASAETAAKVGIDVSYHQGTIDWTKVKSSGVEFVMLRIGYDYSMDTKFTTYLAGAKSVGLDIGVYFYSYADNVQDAINEAKNCVTWLDQYPATFSYPIVYDAEESKISSFAADACAAFCEVLSDSGYYPMIYANTNWLNNVITPLSKVSHIEFWQANYRTSYSGKTPAECAAYAENRPALNSYNSNVRMWQCTDGGSVAGISGGVDTNISYVDFSEIIPREGYNGYNPSAPKDRSAVCTGTRVNIRSAPTTASEILGEAVTSDTFPLKRRYNSRWLEVDYKGNTAYVFADYFSVQEEELTAIGQVTCTGTGVNIRLQPNTDCAVIGGANNGDVFPLLEVVNEEWYKIAYDGGVAYISARYSEATLPPPTTEPSEPNEPTNPAPPTEPNTPNEPTVVAPKKKKSGCSSVAFTGSTGLIMLAAIPLLRKRKRS